MAVVLQNFDPKLFFTNEIFKEIAIYLIDCLLLVFGLLTKPFSVAEVQLEIVAISQLQCIMEMIYV